MKKKRQILHLNLRGEITESPSGFNLLRKKEQIALYDLVSQLEKASSDPKIVGLLMSVQNTKVGWAQAEEIKAALTAFKQKGKAVYTYLEQPDNVIFYMVSDSDYIALPPAASLELTGLRGEVFFFRRLFDQIGIQAELFSVGEYKAAGEMFQRKSLSSASRKMTDAILSQFHKRLVQAVAGRTKLSDMQAEETIDSGPFTAKRAHQNGLIDSIAYEDELKEKVKRELDSKILMPASKFFRHEGLFKRLITFRRPQIAIIEAEGMISTGESHRGKSHWPTLGSRTIIEQLRDARKRKRIKSIVLRLNSPGGSGLASDLIWREIQLTNEKKPVIISFGNVSASGGYYISTGGSTIFASTNTLTGSIGVIGGKFNVKGLLQRLGISVDSVSKGAHSGYTTISRAFRESEAKIFKRQLTDFYEDLFLKRVSEGRSMDVEDLRKSAEGRVWTGDQALEEGLVDRIGGIMDAISAARKAVGLGDKKTRIVIYAPKRSLRDLLPVQLNQDLIRERILAIAPFLPDIR